MQFNKPRIAGIAIKEDKQGPYIEVRLQARATTEQLAELYGMLLMEDGAIDVEITSKQAAFA